MQLGNIEITYFDTITLPGNWEYSTDIYLTLKNKGSSPETVEFTRTFDLMKTFPQWAWMLFEFQKNTATLAPGEERGIHYFISNEGEGEFSFNIDFWKTNNPSEKATTTIKIASKGNIPLEASSAVYGIVKDNNGNPVSGVDVSVVSYNGREKFVQRTGQDGKYLVGGPAAQGYDASLFDAATGKILKSMGTDDQWLRNSKFYADGRKFVLGKSSGYLAAYDISGNNLWNLIMGEFPMFMDIGSNDVLYASGKSRSLYAIDASGNVKWTHRIPDHSGGAGAVSADGSRIAIGTGSGWVYLFDGSGNLLWRVKTDGESIGHNAIAITADGKHVVAGTAPQNTVVVFDEKGNKVWSYSVKPSPNAILDEKYVGIGYKTSKSTQEGVMNAVVSPDAMKIAVAYGDNFVRMFGSG